MGVDVCNQRTFQQVHASGEEENPECVHPKEDDCLMAKAPQACIIHDYTVSESSARIWNTADCFVYQSACPHKLPDRGFTVTQTPFCDFIG